MPTYINPHPYAVQLVGPSGEIIVIKSKESKVLPEFFERYRQRGFVQSIDPDAKPIRQGPKRIATKPIAHIASPVPPTLRARQKIIRPQLDRSQPRAVTTTRIVGKSVPAGRELEAILSTKLYPISNNIGVGILSYNRGASLARLIASILEHTDLNKTTIFVSDDNSTDPTTLDYLAVLGEDPRFVVLRNRERLGIAGNTNRLFQCLSRFKYGLLLNDDVQVLAPGWEYFYPEVMGKTGFHHFIYRQPGVYGAKPGDPIEFKEQILNVVHEKPQGAVLAFTNELCSEIGHFNPGYGLYGMEHVDWSMRAWESGLQKPGFFDVQNSSKFFRIHGDGSAVADRHQLLAAARKVFETRLPGQKHFVERSLPAVSYVVPVRNRNRTGAIETVLHNVRAQRFPIIDIILSEHDSETYVDLPKLEPFNYVLATAKSGDLFNKAIAFNQGVLRDKTGIIIMHDADMMVSADYTAEVYKSLQSHESCHMGGRVLYADQASTAKVNEQHTLLGSTRIERLVGYFEGGSLAARTSCYWAVGGFNEDYWGYGCFLPGHYVLAQDGYKKIEAVTADDKLFTHAARYQPIELRQRSFDGPVFSLYIPGRLPIKGVTPEHPFLVQVDGGDFMWRKAKDLRKGDTLASTDYLPELVPSYDLASVAAADRSKNHFDLSDNMLDFCYLLGLYLAEGVLQTPQKLRIIYYFLHKDENFLVSHIEELINRLNPGIGMSYSYIKRNCREVRVFNSLLAKLIYAICGKHLATSKVVSTKFLDQLSQDQLANLLAGACDGDANHHTGSESRLIYHTSSVNLAMAFSGVMRKLGIAHSFGKRKGGGFEGSSESSFDLCVNREFENRIPSIYPKPPYFGSNSTGKSKFGTIYDIKCDHYAGPVYNFEVEEDHSYVVQGIVTHNCEDCDFYTRLSHGSNFRENRSFDFVHLWHDRTEGWNAHHLENRKLEARLRANSVQERIAMQRIQLKNRGYIL